MNRKETTAFLGKLLINKMLNSQGKHWASEVSLDYGSDASKRVDYMQFIPVDQISVSGIEKGIFVCYEIKSCKEDYHSGFGQNFIGEKNYLVMSMQTYKDVMHEIPVNVGVLVPIPVDRDEYSEFEEPTPLSDDVDWNLKTIKPAYSANRKKSMCELLFCMLRAGRNYVE